MAVTADVGLAFRALSFKKKLYDKFWRYYDGDQPLVYNSERLREIFSGLDARFTQNWCAVVVDSVLDRLEMQVPHVGENEAADDALRDLWQSTGMEEDGFNIHEDVCVTGEAFVVAWTNPETGEVEAFHNDARLIHVEYDLENPKKIRFAAKWWNDTDGGVRMTLYYDDRLEYYISRKMQLAEMVNEKSFVPYDGEGGASTVPNPFGRVPVFHFRSNTRKTKSQLTNVLEVQDAINKLLSDMMVAAEFGAFPQRYIISQTGIDELRNNPNEIWDLPAAMESGQGTSAGQFGATDLGNYLNAIGALSTYIGISTRTPRHYFFLQGGDPSGDALVTMEAPLQRKVSRLVASLRPAWRALAAFMLELKGVRNIKPQMVNVEYDPFQTIQPGTQAQIRKVSKDTGIPLITLLRDEGWTEADIEQMYQDMSDELDQQQKIAAKVAAFQREQAAQAPDTAVKQQASEQQLTVQQEQLRIQQEQHDLQKQQTEQQLRHNEERLALEKQNADQARQQASQRARGGQGA